MRAALLIAFLLGGLLAFRGADFADRLMGPDLVGQAFAEGGEDAYYFFTVARNIAAGRGITIDGVHWTTGFQPLWAAVCAVAFALAPDRGALALVYLASFACWLGGAWLLIRFVHAARGGSLPPASAHLHGPDHPPGENNVTIMGHVTIGQHNHLYPGVVIGGEPQDYSYRGSDTQVVIGNHNIIRECVTINRATEKEDGITALGDHNFLMACSHVAHDCKLGSHIVIANGTLLGGHVHVHDHASLSGGIGVHHYASIGSYSFVSGLSRVIHDVPPFMLVEGIPARPRCINIVALKRNDFSAERVETIAVAHRLLYRSKVGLNHAREIMRTNNQLSADVERLFSFIEGQQVGKHGRGREVRRAA